MRADVQQLHRRADWYRIWIFRTSLNATLSLLFSGLCCVGETLDAEVPKFRMECPPCASLSRQWVLSHVNGWNEPGLCSLIGCVSRDIIRLYITLLSLVLLCGTVCEQTFRSTTEDCFGLYKWTHYMFIIIISSSSITSIVITSNSACDRDALIKPCVTECTHFYRKRKPLLCLFIFGNKNKNLYLPFV